MVLDGLGDDVIIGFQDESTQRTDLSRCRTWGLGKVVRTNATEPIAVNTMGFYPIEGTPVCSFPERGNSATFIEFLGKVRGANGDRKIVMVLDNCRIHRTAAVLEAAAGLDIVLCFLPPYSPQWNPIEYIWKTVKFELSKFGILERHQVEAVVEEVFMKESGKRSYCQYWVDFLIDILPKKLCY